MQVLYYKFVLPSHQTTNLQLSGQRVKEATKNSNSDVAVIQPKDMRDVFCFVCVLQKLEQCLANPVKTFKLHVC